MKHLLSAAAASALMAGTAFAGNIQPAPQEPVIAPAPMPVASVDNWGGFYVYGLAGYEDAESKNEHRNVNPFGGPGGTYKHSGDDGVYGLAAGYNWQFNDGIVVGAELGIRSGTKINDGDAYAIYNNYTKSKLESLGTLKARLGYDLGQWMPYVTAGVAHGKLKSHQLIATPTPQTWDASKSATGYVIGAGADIKLTEQIFTGIEYNYTDLGSVTFSEAASNGTATDIKGHYKSHSVVAKIGFRF